MRNVNRNLLVRVGVVCVLCAAGLLLLVQRYSVSSPSATPRPSPRDLSRVTRAGISPPPAPLPASPFLNTGSEALYLGSGACRECHPDAQATYQQTGMGHSLAELATDQEPADGEFSHALSGRRYRVYRKDGQMHHRETMIVDDAEYPLADFPVQCVIGSGKHSRSYLVEIDGFLVESPITWYTSQQAWSISPGYDAPLTPGFTREVPEKCLFCHAGRAEAIDHSLHRIRFLEHAIGCERCHGPGSLHVARWRDGTSNDGGDQAIDPTIVNPIHLSRALADAICQQCHLTTTAYVAARGRKLTDFRPGLPLERFRHYYRPRDLESSMRVVGHVDQLMMSRCYRESDSLACMSCHNPHGFPTPEKKIAHYRQACLRCHQEQSCGVDPEILASTNPANDCAACHMPTTSTDIPHMAFTHHRIGIHRELPPSESSPRNESPMELEPLHNLSFLGTLDRERALGLAYLELSQRAANEQRSGTYRKRASDLLFRVQRQGLHDGEVDAALAQIVWPQDAQAAAEFAEGALEDASLSPIARVNALFAIAANHLALRRPERALAVMQELTRMRRHAADWSLIGECYFALGDISAGVTALEKASQIDPHLLEIQDLLARHYDRVGEPELAKRHRAIATGIGNVMDRTRGDKSN